MMPWGTCFTPDVLLQHQRLKSKPRIVYISAPMTGEPAENRPLFDAWAKRLRSHGFRVISPPEQDSGDGTIVFRDVINRDIDLVKGCDVLMMLPGWQNDSVGCRLEHICGQLKGLLLGDRVVRTPKQTLFYKGSEDYPFFQIRYVGGRLCDERDF